jgi:transposase-like protein
MVDQRDNDSQPLLGKLCWQCAKVKIYISLYLRGVDVMRNKQKISIIKKTDYRSVAQGTAELAQSAQRLS